MLPKMSQAQKPPQDFSDPEKWKLTRSFNITRTKSADDNRINLEFFKASIHNCIETTPDKNYGIHTFAKVSIFRNLNDKVGVVIGCLINFFEDDFVLMLSGFIDDHSPALYLKDHGIWYYCEHIKGLEISPNQQSWQKLDFKDVSVHIAVPDHPAKISFLAQKST